MKILLFGATGALGQAVLRECLTASDVTGVTAVLRAATGRQDPRLREVIHHDFFDLTPISRELADHDACLFCLGVSAASLTGRDYRRITHDLTLAAASTLVAADPGMTFLYVSGSGADSSEEARVLGARVRSETETAILDLPFRAAYIFRPEFTRPPADSRLLALWRRLFPRRINTREEVGRAMLTVARRGFAGRVLATDDIRRAART